MDSLTQEQKEQYGRVFREFDVDGNGTMNLQELGNALRRLKLHPTLQELKAMMRECDANGSGTLDEMEFLDLVARRVEVGETREDLIKAFRLFDKDETGTISSSELRHLLTTVGETLTEAEVDKILKDVGVLPNGDVDVCGFVDKIMN